MAVRYFCDRCDQEMADSTIVSVGAQAPVQQRSRDQGVSRELCPECAVDFRKFHTEKIVRPPKREGDVNAAAVDVSADVKP